mmetsp:Transcript_19450/g.46978  ORF Transcript_19450/g.46978 Transcript_19450/m.46978 type:complete len:554 (-) Transcript_19450:24-1685(-)
MSLMFNLRKTTTTSEKYAAAQRQVKHDAAMFRSVSMVTELPSFARHGLLPTIGEVEEQQQQKQTPTKPQLDRNASRRPADNNNINKNHKVERTRSMPIDFEAPSSSHWNNSPIPSGTNTNYNTNEDPMSQQQQQQQWKVTTLRTTPMYYPLERTAVVVDHATHLDEITSTISWFLRHHSISAVFHNELGRVDCMTSNMLKFSIQLWQKSVPLSIESAPSCPSVVVEMQRRSGCCIEMLQLRQELMRHLLTPSRLSGNSEPASGEGSEMKKTFTCGALGLEEHHHHHPLEALQSVIESALEIGEEQLQEQSTDAFLISLTLLQSPQLSQNRLGLESLSILADQCSVSKIQAQHTASRIMMDPHIHAILQSYFVGTQVSSSFLDRRVHNGRSYNNDDLDDEEMDRVLDYEQGKLFGAMHILALKVLAKSLDTWMNMMDGSHNNDKNKNGNTDNIRSSSVLDVSPTFWNQVVVSCLYDIEAACHRPLEASLSVHCLRLLTSLVPESRTVEFLKQGGPENLDIGHILLAARCYGRQHHRSLERETEVFMSQLGITAI